jgi:RNA polymerase sigma-70 factor (ECF subfamily)
MIDYYRAQARRLPAMGVDVEDLPNQDDDGPDTLAHVRELVDRSLALLQTLPQDQREIILMYVEGLSMAEIGAIARVPAETARSRLRRALAKLRQELEGLAS